MAVNGRTQKRNGTNEENKETKRKYEIKKDQQFFRNLEGGSSLAEIRVQYQMFCDWCVESSNKNCFCQGMKMRRDRKIYIFYSRKYTVHHINFILMFLYYFQFLIIHVNSRISFRSQKFSPVLDWKAYKSLTDELFFSKQGILKWTSLSKSTKEFICAYFKTHLYTL